MSGAYRTILLRNPPHIYHKRVRKKLCIVGYRAFLLYRKLLYFKKKEKALRRGAGQKGTRRDRSEEENRISLVTVKNVFVKKVV